VNSLSRALSWIVLAAVTATLVAAGFWLLFTTFMIYDDEGYVLLSLKNFSLHGALYDRVYTQYGPFPYFLYDGLHRVFGFAFTNTTGRWITLVNWLGTAGACAALVARQTRSALWSAFTLAGVYIFLWVMINEPVHPGGLLAFLLALGTWSGAEAWAANRPVRFAVITALVGAALALTKINVGIFFLGAAFSWLALNTAPAATARTLTWLVAAGCALLPFALMRSLLAAHWVRLFALIFTGSALATLLAVRTAARPVVTARAWGWFAGTLVGAVTVLCALTLVRGSSLGGLLHGVVLEPLKHPGVYFFPMNWRSGSGTLALGSLGLAAWAARAGWLSDPRFQNFVAGARLIATAVFLCSPLEIIPTGLAAWSMSYGVTLAWIFALPLRSDRRSAEIRAWVALVLVFAFLHAYPVAGSQINWATYLWVPLLVLGLHDAAPLLRSWCGRWAKAVTWVGMLVIVGTTCKMAGQLANIGWTRYPTSQRLNLPGAENIRLPDDATYALRIVTENLRAHADMLFSFPGTYSANLWTDLPTPTLTNATHWFSLLSDERQQEIIDRLAAASRPVLLVERDVLDYLRNSGFKTHGLLHDWLMANFERAFALDGYEVWVRHGRQIAALSTARFGAVHSNSCQLTLTLTAPPRPVTHLELCDDNAPKRPLATLTSENTSATFEPIDLTGTAVGPVQPLTFPLKFSGLARITLHYSGPQPHIEHGRSLILLRDVTGGIVAEVRVLE